MTMAGPLTVFGIRYCTYIWLTVMVPGCGALNAEVPGWLDMVVTPLTKKLPSSASSSGPPSVPAMAVPPVASSAAVAASAAQKFRSMRIMATSRLRAMDHGPSPCRPASIVPESIWRTRRQASEQRRGQIAELCPSTTATLPLNQQGGTGLTDRGGTYYSPPRGPSGRVGGMSPAGAGDDRGHNGGRATRVAGQRH